MVQSSHCPTSGFTCRCAHTRTFLFPNHVQILYSSFYCRPCGRMDSTKTPSLKRRYSAAGSAAPNKRAHSVVEQNNSEEDPAGPVESVLPTTDASALRIRLKADDDRSEALQQEQTDWNEIPAGIRDRIYKDIFADFLSSDIIRNPIGIPPLRPYTPNVRGAWLDNYSFERFTTTCPYLFHARPCNRHTFASSLPDGLVIATDSNHYLK